MFKTIGAEEAGKMIERPETFILDARTPGEFADGHLRNAVLIPHTEVRSRLSQLPSDKEKPILVYCAHGMRSMSACQALAGLGYKKLFNLDGGIAAWLDAGKPIV